MFNLVKFNAEKEAQKLRASGKDAFAFNGTVYMVKSQELLRFAYPIPTNSYTTGTWFKTIPVERERLESKGIVL